MSATPQAGPRSPRRRARGRASTLSQQAIVDAAFELANREGVAALTMRRLGEELGVDATAFYRHFRDKDDLVVAVGDRAAAWSLERAREQLTDESDWRDVLRTVASASWEAARRFPAVFALTFARTTGGTAERELVELLLTSMTRAGLDGRDAVLTYRVFADTILGLGGTLATIVSLDESAQEKDLTAWSRIYAALPHETYPTTRQHAADLIGVTDDEIFTAAVDGMIAAVEARVGADRRATPRTRAARS